MKRYDWQQKLNTIVLQVATLSDLKLTLYCTFRFSKDFLKYSHPIFTSQNMYAWR